MDLPFERTQCGRDFLVWVRLEWIRTKENPTGGKKIMLAWFSLSSTVWRVSGVFFFFSIPSIYSWVLIMKPCSPNNQPAEMKRGQRNNSTSTMLWLHKSVKYTCAWSCQPAFNVKTDRWQSNTRWVGHTRRSTWADKAVCGGWGVWIVCKK